LVEIDDYEQQLILLSPHGCERLQAWIGDQCRALGHIEATVVQINESRWAILIPNCDRKSAVRRGGELLAARKESLADSMWGELPRPTLSIGAATLAAVSTNFSPTALVESAERCLYGASVAGGGMVKSIEIY